MRHEFHPEAREEYFEAIAYYDSRRSGLGGRFVLEVERVIERILEAPSRWESVDEEGDVRRCLAHTFPYGILYSIEPDFVLILAVMHLSREPNYWRKRTK